MTAVTLVPFPSTAESDIRSNMAIEGRSRGSRGRHTPLPPYRLGSKKVRCRFQIKIVDRAKRRRCKAGGRRRG
eukprot:4569932-Prymnesium_polylepis.1